VTEYVVLRQQPVDEGEAFHIVAYEKARSARAAIQTVVADTSVPENGHFVAVPARSWRPVSVTVQTETKIKIG
jgi:hypothetical protein